MADVIENSVSRDDCSQDQNNFNEATNNIDNNSSSNFSNSLNNDTNLSAKDCNGGSTNPDTMVENQAMDTSDCPEPEDQTTMSEKSEIINNNKETTNDNSNSFIEKPEINQNSIDSTDDRNEISNSCDSSQNFKRNETENSDHDEINSRESGTNQSNAGGDEENKPKNDFKNVISENHNSSTNGGGGTEDEESNLSNNKDLLSAEKIPNGKENGDSLDDVPMKDEESLSKDDLSKEEENKIVNDKPEESNSSEKCLEESETPDENKNGEKDPTMDNDVTIIDSDEDDEDPLKEASAENELKLNDVLAASKQDEDPFLINSDSESESQKNKMDDGQTNNDDDDVVLIDDDDDGPPAKKLRSHSNDPLDVSHGSISIKDARSINSYSPINTGTSGTIVINPTAFVKNNGKPGPFPVAIGTDINQMPKINSNPTGTQPILGINPNLLPALTDDMFVLEAPSFIVPYIYEKPPGTSLKEIVEKIKPEIVSQEKTPEEETALELEKLSQLSALNETIPDDSSNTNNTSSKKKKKNKTGDESWDESGSEEDDCSDEEARMKVLIKNADTDINLIKQVIAPADKIVPAKLPVETTEKKGDSYFESPLGRFFIDIGVDLVQEYVQADLLKTQKRKMRRSVQGSKESQEIEMSIKALSKNLETSRKRNSNFHFHSKRCEFCYFKTESALVMAHHYETPHMDKNMYKCNFCNFEIRQNQEILFHLEAVHNIKGRLEKAISYHQCPNCPFEDNGRSKLARHQPVCAKKFRPELNLCPPNDWEAPAKIPKIKPKHGLVGTATAYQAMAAQAAAQKAALASLQQQQQAARNLLVSNNVNKNKKPVTPQRMNPMNRPIQQNANVLGRSAPLPMMNNQRQPLPTSGPISANTYNIAKNSPLIQAQNQRRAAGQPSISITPLPRQTQASNMSSPQMNANIPKNNNMKAAGAPPGNKSSFVICEICDGYIKDLEQLRNHMQWMHKVKIHPKMIFNRPPLNCQKCQFRFFTDQGLERHLLGSHGLVTSSMQDAANKGKDAGRCPVCGRVYQWKLLNHVSRDHNMTLKPAHLSYKCTVCTATFGMYKEFENHVYTAHSTVAKKSSTAVDNMKKGNNSNINSNNLNAQRPSGSNCNNESLLKPLRINDEITIIPQGAKKL